MEAAIQTVVKVFLKSGKGKESMGGGDFDNLVKKNLGNILSDTDSKSAMKEMRQGLDDNQDGKVSFQEYMKLIGYLATTLSQQRAAEQPAEGQVAAAADANNSAPAQENDKAAAAKAPQEEGEKEAEAVQPEAATGEEKEAEVEAAAAPAASGEAEKAGEEAVATPAAVVEEEVEAKTEEAAS